MCDKHPRGQKRQQDSAGGAEKQKSAGGASQPASKEQRQVLDAAPETNKRNEWPETIWLTRKMLSWHSTGPENMLNRSGTVLDEWEPFNSGDLVDS